MTKIRVLTISVICLVLINLVLIGGILIGGPKPFREPKMFIIERLDFTTAQVLEYEDLIEVHKNDVAKNGKEIKALKDELYLTLIINDEAKQSKIIEEIVLSKKKIEILHLNHFKDIKLICKPEQQEKFSKLVEELPRLFLPPSHKKKH